MKQSNGVQATPAPGSKPRLSEVVERQDLRKIFSLAVTTAAQGVTTSLKVVSCGVSNDSMVTRSPLLLCSWICGRDESNSGRSHLLKLGEPEISHWRASSLKLRFPSSDSLEIKCDEPYSTSVILGPTLTTLIP